MRGLRGSRVAPPRNWPSSAASTAHRPCGTGLRDDCRSQSRTSSRISARSRTGCRLPTALAVPRSRRSRTPPGYLRQTKTAIGWLYYPYLKPNRYALLHAEVESSHQRQGVAGATVRRVLDEIRAREGTITAICSFVADDLSRTPPMPI
ncbi:N-acetyltransferase [Actinoallomurus sp. NPDC052308]|uniref:GNAT family N-acetyltransferase n=1 Tax=Actinoallomurus sp. NPDC052308 TaxID=3155530 RepID=UPI0034255011